MTSVKPSCPNENNRTYLPPTRETKRDPSVKAKSSLFLLLSTSPAADISRRFTWDISVNTGDLPSPNDHVWNVVG